jgi:hypothetical protein
MAKQPKKKSKIRTLIKWVRRISFVAGVIGAYRQWQVEQKQNESQPPSQ